MKLSAMTLVKASGRRAGVVPDGANSAADVAAESRQIVERAGVKEGDKDGASKDGKKSARSVEKPTSKASKHTAAVACVESHGKWLLGLSTATDERKDKWSFPGGGINGSEQPKRAAERECQEEAGISVRAVGEPFTLPEKPGVAFVHCRPRVARLPLPRHNKEFRAMGWFSLRELKKLPLHGTVLKAISRC